MEKNYSHKISIIIPYYNPILKYFDKAIESILSQSYTNLEAIIVNDGSSLDYKNYLINKINSLNDKRFSIIHLDKNYGVSFAKNKGIESASGEIITFLDTDDIHLPWFYKDIVDTFNENPDCLILHTTNIYYVDLLGVIKLFVTPNEGWDQKCINYKQVVKPRLALKKEVFKDILFDTNLFYAEDTDLCLQISENNKLQNSTLLLKRSSYLYRMHLSNKRLTHNLKLALEGREKVKRKYEGKDSTSGSFVQTITLKKTLVPFFGIDYRYLRVLINFKYNLYKKIRNEFTHYLNVIQDKNIKSHAVNIYKKIF
ncbi:MAG: glycosyltransferase [Candidatus Melainabacteria bacterium]|nr:glycosyltransferase [Candidatus Melainabacteria bacterium]